MEALGQLSLAERAEAEIQKYVAEFLGMKSKLVNLKSHPSLQIQGKASGLYTDQIRLENELKENLAKIEQMKSTGVFSISDTLAIGAFAAQLYGHINNVKNLELEARTIAPDWKPGFNVGQITKDWALPIGLLFIGLIMIGYGKFSKR